MAVARASLLDPIKDIAVDVDKSALVIGGGAAGMTAAISLADQGFPTTLVEKNDTLGGAARDLHQTWNGQDVQAFLADLAQKIDQHAPIEVLTGSEVVAASGFVGNYETEVKTNGTSQTVKHGVAIVATGGQAVETDEYLYGKHPQVTRWHDLENDPEKTQRRRQRGLYPVRGVAQRSAALLFADLLHRLCLAGHCH